MIKFKSSVTPNLYWNKINCYNCNMMVNYELNKYAFSKPPAGFLLSETNTQESQELPDYLSELQYHANCKFCRLLVGFPLDKRNTQLLQQK